MAGNVTLLRGNTVGGSSIFFFGSAWEPPLDLLAEHGLDLRAEVEVVKEELRPAVLPRDVIGPRGRRIADSALELGYDWKPIPKFLDPDRLGDPPMGAYAAPSYEAKWNARKFVDQAVDAGATLVTGARGVEFVHERRSRRASAGRVVLAAGGFGSPRILRASGIERAGREWFYDPLISVVGSLPGLEADPELPMVAGAELADEGYMLTDITVPPWWFGMDAALSGRLDRLLSHRRSLSIMVKIRDELSGEITRRGGVGKRLTDGDRDKLSAGYQRARRILEHAGARRGVGSARTRPRAVRPSSASRRSRRLRGRGAGRRWAAGQTRDEPRASAPRTSRRPAGAAARSVVRRVGNEIGEGRRATGTSALLALRGSCPWPHRISLSHGTARARPHLSCSASPMMMPSGPRRKQSR